MKRYLTSLMKLKIFLLLLLFGSCGLVSRGYLKTSEKKEMQRNRNIQVEKRSEDYNLSKMSIEEFQRFASVYFETENVRLEPFIFLDKNVEGLTMAKEGVLYYVQSLSARGVSYKANGNEVAADLRIGIQLIDEQYFLSDATYYLIVNDFACDALTVSDQAWSGGGEKLADNKIYCVGWKAVRY